MQFEASEIVFDVLPVVIVEGWVFMAASEFLVGQENDGNGLGSVGV